jgi:hypothetical protein
MALYNMDSIPDLDCLFYPEKRKPLPKIYPFKLTVFYGNTHGTASPSSQEPDDQAFGRPAAG